MSSFNMVQVAQIRMLFTRGSKLLHENIVSSLKLNQ